MTPKNSLNLLRFKFWFVTRPTQQSTMEDICFEATLVELQAQFRGGLLETDLAGQFMNESDAVKFADALLDFQNGFERLVNLELE